MESCIKIAEDSLVHHQLLQEEKKKSYEQKDVEAALKIMNEEGEKLNELEKKQKQE